MRCHLTGQMQTGALSCANHLYHFLRRYMTQMQSGADCRCNLKISRRNQVFHHIIDARKPKTDGIFIVVDDASFDQ